MRAPALRDQVTLIDERQGRPVPPAGFVTFTEGDLGDGDRMGLYWPIGREEAEPVVVEFDHHARRLTPTHSSLAAWLEAGGGESDEGETVGADDDSPWSLHEEARELLRSGDLDGAILPLERAVTALPEYGEALITLWGQACRLRRMEEAVEIALQAIRSPPAFGPHLIQAQVWLAKQDESPAAIVEDPLWRARRELRLEFGGVKRNRTYTIFAEAIATCADRGRFVEAVTLHQSYGELMSWETVSFHERYGYSAESHARRLDELCAAGGLDRRTLED